jgi:pimeloyl-ACP methyl ester carboxylesterase
LNRFAPPNATKYLSPNESWRPRVGGKDFIKDSARSLSTLMNDQLILVGFDPRGIGESTSIWCGRSFQAEVASFIQSGNLEGTARDYIYNSVAKLIAKECQLYTGKLLQFMSTFYHARDMEEIRKFLGMDTMRYWGFSYGSLLGTVYANMFPQLASNVVIDGIVDPTFYHGNAFDFHQHHYSTMKESLLEFGRICDSVSAKACALSRKGMSSYRRIMDLVQKLEKDPVLMIDSEPAVVVTKNHLLVAIHDMLYRTNAWPIFAQS